MKGDDAWNTFTTVDSETAQEIGIITAALVAVALFSKECKDALCCHVH